MVGREASMPEPPRTSDEPADAAGDEAIEALVRAGRHREAIGACAEAYATLVMCADCGQCQAECQSTDLFATYCVYGAK